MKNRITDIHCPQCGAPASFDIVQQMYVCGHCGGTVGITEAVFGVCGATGSGIP